MRITEYSIGQIQCILASERGDRDLINAAEKLIGFLVERQNRLQNYQVQKEVELVRSKPPDLNRRKLVSIEREEFDHCTLVDD